MEAFEDEVIDGLFVLNVERAEAVRRAVAVPTKAPKKPRAKKAPGDPLELGKKPD